MMGRYPHFGGRPGPSDEQVADEVMQQFDVTEFSNRDYQTLSGGERQRVNFARVLAQLWPSRTRATEDNPASNGELSSRHADRGELPAATSATRYLFLDEPLTFLDIRHQIDFMKKIREFTDATDVVTVGVVHDLNLAARFADQIVLLSHSRVVAKGTSAEVLTTERIQEVFGVQPTVVQTESLGVHLIFN